MKVEQLKIQSFGKQEQKKEGASEVKGLYFFFKVGHISIFVCYNPMAWEKWVMENGGNCRSGITE